MNSPNRTSMPLGGRPTQKGFSLVELMVALVLGLVIVGGVINIFLGNQQAFRTNDQLGRLQENARISFEQMAREIRQAGGNACGVGGNPERVSGTVIDWTTKWKEEGAIQGFAFDEEATGIVDTGTGTAERVNNTDAIKLLSGNLGEANLFTSPDAPPKNTVTTSFAIQAGHSFTDGLFLACDSGAAIFFDNGEASPSAFTGVQQIPVGVNLPNTIELKVGGFIAPYTAGFWYIGNNGRAGGRSLFRTGVGTGSAGPVEIAEGVTDMQIDYLLRPKPLDSITVPGAPNNAWLGAEALKWTNSLGSATGWIDDPGEAKNPTQEVVAVRLTLTLVTEASVGTGTTSALPITRQLIHVVNLRNRGMR